MNNRVVSSSAFATCKTILDSPALTGVFLSSSQQVAVTTLIKMVALSRNQNTYGGFRIRSAPLLYGGSGAGKTAIVRECARQLGTDGKLYPLLSISCPAWVVLGAKAEITTLSLLRRFVQKNTHGLIHLDELDKLVPPSKAAFEETWNVCLTGEVISAIDARPGDTRLLGAGWSRCEIERLSNFTFIGSGAWVRALEKADHEGISHSEAIEQAQILPVEISRRFSPRHLEITPPTHDDFRRALNGLYRDLGLPVRDSLLDVVADAGVTSGLGFRFIESHLVDLLLRYPNLQQPRAKEKPAQKRETFPVAAYDQRKREIFALFEALSPAIAHLRVHVKLHHQHFFPKRDDNDPFQKEDKITAMDFDCRCMDLLTGLQLAYAPEKDRSVYEKLLWHRAQDVGDFLSTCLENDLPWLADRKLISLFTNCQIRLSRAIAAWGHLCTLDIQEVGE